jgi:carbon-monoxide dehydrogenase medium subunit
MLPARFELHRPESVAAALALLAEHGDDATPYAGGTELLIALKARVLRYAHVVDLKRIDALRGVSEGPDGTLIIGALATHHQLAQHPLIRERLPAYAELSNNVANIRVRVSGTLGGNLCFAEPHADPPALLCALQASVRLAGAAGERVVAMEDFIMGEFTTARADGELLLSIEIPRLPAGARAAYRASGHLERPAAGVAAVAMPKGAGFEWRFWAGAVSGRPTRLESVEKAAAGLKGSDAIAAIMREAPAAANALEAHDDLHGGAEYKRHLVTVLARRAAEACLS